MRSKNVNEWIANYIKDQGFSVEELSFHLKLPESKLRGGTENDLSAEEFLNLCSYLKVTPEQIRNVIR